MVSATADVVPAIFKACYLEVLVDAWGAVAGESISGTRSDGPAGAGAPVSLLPKNTP